VNITEGDDFLGLRNQNEFISTRLLFSTVTVLRTFPNSHKHIPVNSACNSQTGVITLYDLQ